MRTPRWLGRAWAALREFEWSWSLVSYLGIGGKMSVIISGGATAIIAALQGVNASGAIMAGTVTAAALVILFGAARAPSLKSGHGVPEEDHQEVSELKGTATIHPLLFAGHMALEAAYPIHDQMRRVRHIDGLWLAGRAVFQLDDAAIRGTVRRIILPTPDSPLLQEMSRWTGIPYGAADLAIQESTDRVKRLGVEVRWLHEFPGFTLLLADSGDEAGYAHVETLLPHTDPGNRPIQRIERTSEPMVFDRFVKMFDALWERAVEPGTDSDDSSDSDGDALVDRALLDRALNANERLATASGAEIKGLEQHNRTLRSEMDQFKGQMAAQEEREAENHALRAEYVEQVQKLKTEFQAERAAHQQTQALVRMYSDESQYGITERRQFPEIDEIDLRFAHNEMKKTVRKSLDAANKGAMDIAGSLYRAMEQGDERNRVIIAFFGERRLWPTKRLFQRLTKELNANPRTDYREWLVHYYEAYNEMRRTIGQMADFLQCSLDDLDEYREWRVDDAVFLKEVKDIGVMNDVIEAINKNHDYPLAMPGD